MNVKRRRTVALIPLGLKDGYESAQGVACPGRTHNHAELGENESKSPQVSAFNDGLGHGS